ncbi:MAG: DUF1640 domain-containing protein [Acidimicrobiales bacterium]|nr:DUF1640 domain-containing protein [Acidimicrobiales bacterium]
MAITEKSRHHLYQRLEEALGSEEAAVLMEHLPPVGWADVATKRDLDNLHDRIRVDLANIRTEIAELRTEVRTEMAELRTEVRTEIAELRTEVRTEMAGLRADLRGDLASFRDDMHVDRRTAQRQVILALVVALVSMILSMNGIG